MSNLPFMRTWVDDILADLAEEGWTNEEFGAYMRFLFVAWKKGGIPADEGRRARLAHTTPAKLRKMWPAFEEKWVSDGNGRLVNPRQEREREEAIKRSEAARAAAEERWGK